MLFRSANDLHDFTDAISKGVADRTKLGKLYDSYGKPFVNAIFKSSITKASVPMIEFAAKQAVRTAFAQEYLGGRPSSFDEYGPAGSLAKGLYDTITIKPESKIGRFGKLGQKVAEKMPQIAAMGIDPLDFSTRLFGADDALSAYQGIGSSATNAGLNAMGYLQKGIQKGIYNIYK